ncbi:TraR/DksA C4-type zinc finger protein [Acidovorax sp. Root217]|uniref:TraR/DksA family transcriptional regulator n=1 Tax=Acidovorax sp. Root217 TaxID=1736492 RepID=UPI000B1941E1|nr:TraR/DksA C4-type zinc finger protein [Acidovorax sp. Root217]
MNTIAHLSRTQRTTLAGLLQVRRTEMLVLQALHRQGLSQAYSAREGLAQDAGDAPQQANERTVEGVLSDMHSKEFNAVVSALRRIHAKEYGLCIDCMAAIPFQRLSIEPQALRCVGCKSRHERSQRMPADPMAVT